MFGLCILVSFSLAAQTKQPVKKPQAKPVQPKAAPAAPVFKNQNDSLSYAFGVSVGQFLASQGVQKLNYALLNKAIGQSLSKSPLYFDATVANNVINKLAFSGMEKKARAEKERGTKFLENNKKEAGIKVTPSGLQYQVLMEGNGNKPKTTDVVRVHYKGTLIDGKEFDNSYKRGEPAEFGVTNVIKGWTEALQLMPVGSKWRIFIPSELGYGDAGAGSDIPGGATLIFDVELLDIVTK